MGIGSKSDNEEDDDDDEADEYDIFESSMESLFGQHQAASGKPGQKCQLDLGGGVILKYKIPTHQESSNTRLFAHFQWDAGLHLALMLHERCTKSEGKDNEVQIRGKSVLELGAGTCLPSLVCAIGGAGRVIITDYPDDGIIRTIEENIKLNALTTKSKVKGLDWTNAAQVASVLQESPESKGFDLILCADTLWLSDFHAPLLEAIFQLMRKSSTSRVILLSGFHTGRRALTSFYKRAVKAGLCTDRAEEYEGVFEYNAVTRASRPWSSSIPFPSQDGAMSEVEEQGDDNMDDYTERTKWLLHVTLRWADLRK